jgi:hypothetical protein
MYPNQNLVRALEFRCCHEVVEALGKPTFTGALKRYIAWHYTTIVMLLKRDKPEASCPFVERPEWETLYRWGQGPLAKSIKAFIVYHEMCCVCCTSPVVHTLLSKRADHCKIIFCFSKYKRNNMPSISNINSIDYFAILLFTWPD